MDPDSTGRENIVLHGLYLGLKQGRYQESRPRPSSNFTELGSFIDLPLRTYSTGMRARLSFGNRDGGDS